VLNSRYKFLIIRFSSIGDIILTTPLIRCLRATFPNAQIDFLVKKEFAVVLSGNPHINNIITFDKTDGRNQLRQIRMQVQLSRYSMIFDIQKNIRSMMIGVGSRTGIAGFSKKLLARDLLIRFKINIYKEIKPVYLRYFESVETLGVQYDGKGTEVFPSQQETGAVEALLAQNNLPQDKPFLVIAPGAQWENKRWTTTGFATAADAFCNKTGAYTLLIGGPGDVETCRLVQAEMATPSLNLAGKLSLMGSAALLGKAAMVFTNDTGMLHMAQAMKAPVVAVYGPTTRELGFFPLAENSRVAEIELSCRPCTQKGLHSCPKKHFRCMNDLKPELVSKLADELYDQKTSGNQVADSAFNA
jgi:lipopolysaccharide heptosyltransferase II